MSTAVNLSEIARRRHTSKAFDPSRTIPAETMDQLRTLLRYAPSSVNSQPWHFVIAGSEAGKAKVAQGTQGPFAYNTPKVMKASHVVVLCARTDLDDAHLSAVLGWPQAGRRPRPRPARPERQVRPGAHRACGLCELPWRAGRHRRLGPRSRSYLARTGRQLLLGGPPRLRHPGQRRGRCRDFAHVMIALCRALNIPARFATGLDYGADPALGPPDFHAVEAHRWYLFDPSGTAIPMGLVRIGTAMPPMWPLPPCSARCAAGPW
jgi:nitroreductase